MELKNICTKLALLTLGVLSMGIISCNDDDDDEDSKSVSKAAEPFIGYWVTGPIKPTSKSVGQGFTFVNYKEGVMKFFDPWNPTQRRLTDNKITTCSWSYNEKTGVLATTARYGDVNPQWEITLTDEDTWSGIALWDGDKSTQTASHGSYGSLSELLFRDTEWVNGNGKTVKYEFDKVAGFSVSGTAMYDDLFAHWKWIGYSKSTDEMYFNWSGSKYFRFKLLHPYSLKECTLVFDDDDPFIEGGSYKLSKY